MLMTVARVVITALLAVSGLVLVTSAPAFACTCAPGDVAEKADRVDAVFVAEIDGVTEVGARFEYAVTATHAYQGTVERRVTVETRQQTSACGLGELENGTDYVFFATGDNLAYQATSCDGSGPANDKRVAEVEEVLGEGTSIEEPPPPPPVMTKVEESAPASVERLAAPGGALVIVGLLGLLVVGRLARR